MKVDGLLRLQSPESLGGGENGERAGQETNVQHCGAVCGAETGQRQQDGAESGPDSWCVVREKFAVRGTSSYLCDSLQSVRAGAILLR